MDGAAINMVLHRFDIDLRRAWKERTAPRIFAAASCEGQSAVFEGQGETVEIERVVSNEP
jgi:hypothetical protein